jgi:hypothetical protein
MAVDFPKTGVPAELSPEQRKRLVSMFGSVRVYAVNSGTACDKYCRDQP